MVPSSKSRRTTERRHGLVDELQAQTQFVQLSDFSDITLEAERLA